MIIAGAVIAVVGCWIITQSLASSRLGPGLVGIGLTLLLVGVFK